MKISNGQEVKLKVVGTRTYFRAKTRQLRIMLDNTVKSSHHTTSLKTSRGNLRFICATLRTLPVPTTEPGGSSSKVRYVRLFFTTRQSRRSSRSSTGTISHPTFNLVGTSLRLCTSMSISPSMSASSSRPQRGATPIGNLTQRAEGKNLVSIPSGEDLLLGGNLEAGGRK